MLARFNRIRNRAGNIRDIRAHTNAAESDARVGMIMWCGIAGSLACIVGCGDANPDSAEDEYIGRAKVATRADFDRKLYSALSGFAFGATSATLGYPATGVIVIVLVNIAVVLRG